MNPARLPWFRKWFGNRSEGAAADFLKKLGYTILARNFTCNIGELDLVARDGQTIVFVEVRSTGSNDPLRAAQSVNYPKQKKLTKLALYFLKRNKLLEQSARFDVLTVHWPEEKETPEITHYKNAFEAVDW
jgi:putative endonuclease